MNDLITEYGESITVTRTASGSYVNGAWVGGSPSTLVLTATVLPLTPEQIVEMNLGERTKKAIVLYTVAALRTTNDKTLVKADTVTWEGDDYEVQSVAYRPQIDDLEHYRSVAVRVEAS